ncbi:MAG: redoxin family protein [Candidatus Hydrogenedentes bacterium]|nr:redoxin family protein [Candidatus Hydrogenedentota bacterium]
MANFGSASVSIVTGLLFNAAAWAASPPTLETGSAAPDFRLPGIVVNAGSTPACTRAASIEEREFQLSDFAEAKLLCLVFTCNHCPTAQAYEAVLMELARDYQNRGVAVVAISPNDDQAVRLDELGYSDLGDSFEDMKVRALDRKFNFPYLYDGADQKVSLAYGPVATPHVFLFDAERKLRYSGRLTDNENPAKAKTQDTRDALDCLLAGKAITTPKTRPFGCSIKWSDKRASAREALEKWDQEKAGLKMVSPEEVAALAKNDTDKLRVINLWATWCGPCVTEFPHLVEINRMYRNRPFELISISVDDPANRDKVLAFLNKHHASFQNYLYNDDSRDALAEALDTQWPGALPHTVVIAPGGEILYRHNGQFDPLTLKKAIVEKIGRHYF